MKPTAYNLFACGAKLTFNSSQEASFSVRDAILFKNPESTVKATIMVECKHKKVRDIFCVFFS